MPDKKFDRPVVIACEGLDFYHVVMRKYFLESTADTKVFDFMDIRKGKDDKRANELSRWLANVFQNRASSSPVRALGIIRDSEDDAEKMFQSVQYSIERAGLPVPSALSAIEDDGKIAVSVMLVPPGQTSGCHEHMMLSSLSDRYAYTSDFVSTFCDNAEKAYIENIGKPPRPEEKALERWRAKLKVYATIASSEKPEAKLGQSIENGVWDFAKGDMKLMVDFVEALRNHVANS